MVKVVEERIIESTVKNDMLTLLKTDRGYPDTPPANIRIGRFFIRRGVARDAQTEASQTSLPTPKMLVRLFGIWL
jgi:hypothetical protein